MFRTLCVAVGWCALVHAEPLLSVATYQADVTPPLGSPLCGGAVKPAESIDDPLTSRGIVLLPKGQNPIVLCAIDWEAIGNAGHDAWRAALAEAAKTTVDRVAVHCLHQHDAPNCDFTIEALAAEHDLAGKVFNVDFANEAIARTSAALKASLPLAKPVTEIGVGQAEVEKVASNRRILGPDGKVQHVRWTATKDPVVRAFPEGTIDPYVKAVSLWNGNTPVVVMTYYATHPQSHYGQGHVSADFVGMARRMQEEANPEFVHIHFNGAGGNIGAGKYNDGSPENRPVLAERLGAGMKAAWDNTKRSPITEGDVSWSSKDVHLPPREEVSEPHERTRLANADLSVGERIQAAYEVAWLDRCDTHAISIGLLKLGPARILHMPGELFVEYQLAAQEMDKDRTVCMAAYGDGGPGYIGTTESYPQGGYECGIYVSRTSPNVEPVLMGAVKELLDDAR